MKLTLKPLLLSPYELISAGLLSLVVVLLANSKQLLTAFGLKSSNDLIRSSTGTAVSHGLKHIDAFQATDSVVTFLIWSSVGLLCFIVVESLGSAYHQLRLEQQIGSGKFVHPSGFSKSSFWRGVLFDMVTLLFGLIMLGVILGLFVAFALPLGLVYSRVLLGNFSLINVAYLLLGLAVVYVGLCLFMAVCRFLLFRRRVMSLA